MLVCLGTASRAIDTSPAILLLQGFPHLGGKRELKHLLEGFWEGKLSEGDVRKG